MEQIGGRKLGNAREEVISALRMLNSLQFGISLNFVRVRIALNEESERIVIFDSIVDTDFFSNSLLVERFKRTIGERWKIFSPRFEWWRAEENVHQGISSRCRLMETSVETKGAPR